MKHLNTITNEGINQEYRISPKEHILSIIYAPIIVYDLIKDNKFRI